MRQELRCGRRMEGVSLCDFERTVARFQARRSHSRTVGGRHGGRRGCIYDAFLLAPRAVGPPRPARRAAPAVARRRHRRRDARRRCGGADPRAGGGGRRRVGRLARLPGVPRGGERAGQAPRGRAGRGRRAPPQEDAGVVERVRARRRGDDVDERPAGAAAADHRAEHVDVHAVDDDRPPHLPRRLQPAGRPARRRQRALHVGGLRRRQRVAARARLARLDAAGGVERRAQQPAPLPAERERRPRPRRAQPRADARVPRAAPHQVRGRRLPRRNVEVVRRAAQFRAIPAQFRRNSAQFRRNSARPPPTPPPPPPPGTTTRRTRTSSSRSSSCARRASRSPRNSRTSRSRSRSRCLASTSAASCAPARSTSCAA